MRYAKRRDENEAEIVQALETAGCTVRRSDIVDLLVGRCGRSMLLEIKREGEPVRLRPIQKWFRTEWKGQYAVVQTVEQALRAVGL